MTKQEKIEALRLKVAEKVPDIIIYKHTSLIKWDSTVNAFVVCYSVEALDILRTLGNLYCISGEGYLLKYAVSNGNECWESIGICLDLSKTLTEWDKTTINKLYKLFY